MRLKIVALLAVVLLGAVPLRAQTAHTGTISGKVVDQDGLAVPGATVTVQSPALQGTRSATTSANGDYIIPLLPVGDYEVTTQLTGFKTVRETTRVSPSASVTMSPVLTVSSVSETVTVVGRAPGDFGQTGPLAVSYKQDLIGKLPTGRTFASAVALSPQVQTSGPQGSFAIAGAMSYQNLLTINGVVIQDNIRGTPFNLFIEDAIQETAISTGAISAEYGRFAGGVANAITKSGGNEFSGSFRTTFDNNRWVAKTNFPCNTLNQPVSPTCAANDPRTSKTIPIYEATFGGPFVKDKLWFFGAARLRDLKETLTTANFTAIAYPHGTNEKRYEGKLTYSLNANHTFKGSYSKINLDEIGNSFATILDLASLVNRQLPQQLMSANYTGILSPKFFVEAQYARRKFSFIGSGATSTDIVGGTLLLDRARGNARYHAATFCGVCDPEKRDNWDALVKASYFLSTSDLGSHNVVGGFDVFNDQRFSNNHQSGSDYRIFGTTSIIQGSNIFPVFNNDGSTFIRWTPIFQSSQGNNFKTYSGFVNDAWRFNTHWSFNVGVRYDKNSGADSIGRVVVRDSAFSPRFSATFDPKGDGNWALNASYGKYVTAIANSIGDSSSPGGIPATIDFDYRGPAINLGNPANPVDQNTAIQQVFAWFNANGGTSRPTRGAPSIPGLTSQIRNNLASPNVIEFTLGVSKRLGNRGLFRIDGTYRKYRDFYADLVDLTTGRVTDSTGKVFDLDITQNTNVVGRKYRGVSAQLSYRVDEHLNLAGNYTLSETNGNFDGETGPSGPVTASILVYPEYKNISWNAPMGDLATDVRHRARLWAVWDVPLPAAVGSLNISGLETFNTGVPFGAVGVVDTRPFVTNPGYVNPPASVNYYFAGRDAFHLANTVRTDLALNYSHRIGLGKKTEIFVRGIVLNVFNRLKLTNLTAGGGPLGSDAGCGTGGCMNTAILTRNTTATLQPFNPFTTQPVQGVNWNFGPSFGQPTSRFAYGTPRTYQFSVGFRF
jgi:hypothetical protein